MVSEHGDGWTVSLDDGVLVWEFLPDMELSVFGDEAYTVYEEFLKNYDPDGMVTVVKIEDPFTEEAFDVWEESAQRASVAGLERWAVVAEGIKAISLRGKIKTGELDVLTTEDRTEAVEWARNT